MERQNNIPILKALGKEMERSGEPGDVDIAGCLYALTYAIRHEHERELAHHIMSFTDEQMQHDRPKPS